MSATKQTAAAGSYAIAHAGTTKRKRKQKNQSGGDRIKHKPPTFFALCPACLTGSRTEDFPRAKMSLIPGQTKIKHSCGKVTPVRWRGAAA
jgi:hypothetical protein